MFAVASREADLDGRQTWHVQTGTAEPPQCHPCSPFLCLHWVSGSSSARGQYNGSQCLERLKARAALFKCPEISFQGDGLQLPWEHRGLASDQRQLFLLCLTLVTLFVFGICIFFGLKKDSTCRGRTLRRLTAHPLPVVIHTTPGWTEVCQWAWPTDYLSSRLMVCANVTLTSAVQRHRFRTNWSVVGRNQLHSGQKVIQSGLWWKIQTKHNTNLPLNFAQ